MNNLNPLCSINLKANMLQQFRDEETKKKCTMMEGKIMVGGDGIDDYLTNIKLLSR